MFVSHICCHYTSQTLSDKTQGTCCHSQCTGSSDGTFHYPTEVSWFGSSDSQPPGMLLYHDNDRPTWVSVTTHFLRQLVSASWIICLTWFVSYTKLKSNWISQGISKETNQKISVEQYGVLLEGASESHLQRVTAYPGEFLSNIWFGYDAVVRANIRLRCWISHCKNSQELSSLIEWYAAMK